MPRVKIDYVVSFSSEDPEHPASNLLLREVSKKKWLCKKGETSCSVVLQLPRSVKITGVHIGAYHAALVEVLVGRSETSSEQFQVLVPSSVFISREESRRDAPVLRVRSFGADALSAAARDQRWDRVRLVCSQPHNKHAQFGLSFVHVDEAEGAPPPAPAPPGRVSLALPGDSEDEDDFRPGELFAQHRQAAGGAHSASADTGAQIRQATSQALKNKAESSTKLMKTPISKPAGRRAQSPAGSRSDRTRDALLYCGADAAPHARIDRVLAQHQLTNTDTTNDAHHKTKDNSKTKHESHTTNESKSKDEPKRTPRRHASGSPPRAARNSDKPTTDQHIEARKRRRSGSRERPPTHAPGAGTAGRAAPPRVRGAPAGADSGETGPLGGGAEPGPVSAEPHTLLRGAALVLSGYENPHRARVRDLALALGARVLRDWGPDATHLICAFPNTPKLRAVRAARGGGAVPVVRADWLEAVSSRRRVVPWRWFATEDRHRVQPTPEQLLDDEPPPDTRTDPDSGDDTDDEIEKVLQAQKKRRLSEHSTDDVSRRRDDSPVATTSAADLTHAADSDGASTDDERAAPPAPRVSPRGAGGALPHMFAGLTFALAGAPREATRMARYVRAYGGLLLEMSSLTEDSEVDYIVRGEGAAPGAPLPPHARQVPAAWLARCHDAQALLPHDHTDTNVS